jgi:hypothetical protein
MTRFRLRRLAAVTVVIAVVTWLGVGIEETSIDHERRHLLFVKSYPTTKVLFRSYMGCDECDVKDFRDLPAQRHAEFVALCQVKYGFDEPRICNAIFAEQRKIRLERLMPHQASVQ